MNLREEKGFTLIEVIVVAAIIAVLAGIIVPLVFKEVDESKISKAKADVKSIQTAIMMFYKDTQMWPNLISGGGNATLLRTEGNIPNDPDGNFDISSSSRIREHLIENSIGYPKWKGPYLTEANPDPWGNAYIINADSFGTSNPIWILSAGPNGNVETKKDSQTLGGDDIGIRLQ